MFIHVSLPLYTRCYKFFVGARNSPIAMLLFYKYLVFPSTMPLKYFVTILLRFMTPESTIQILIQKYYKNIRCMFTKILDKIIKISILHLPLSVQNVVPSTPTIPFQHPTLYCLTLRPQNNPSSNNLFMPSNSYKIETFYANTLATRYHSTLSTISLGTNFLLVFCISSNVTTCFSITN